ncbi:MAG TPA: hypothetical protein VH092_26805 [Urbifossiella sp.]|nr:hypothetical protein [Urbifossiella sp.]
MRAKKSPTRWLYAFSRQIGTIDAIPGDRPVEELEDYFWACFGFDDVFPRGLNGATEDDDLDD